VTPADLSPLWISLATASAATAITFVLGIAAAAAMHRYTGRGRGVLDGLLTLPLVLPPTVVGFFLLLMFGRRSALGHFLESVGLRIAFSWPGTVLAASVVAFPLMYRATLGAFEQVNPNLLDAARTLGAGEWRTFRRILLPLARPGVTAGVVLAFARALGEFGATLMLAGNIPGKTQTMPVAVFFAAEGGDMDRALLWVVLIVILSLATIAALNYWSPRRLPVRVTETAMAPPAIALHIAPVAGPPSAGSPGLLVDVLKHYPGFDLSAQFSAGARPLGLLGASGSGKSMTLRCIAGLAKPESGRIVLNGRTLLDTSQAIDLPPAQRRVGVVFQDYALFPHISVRENIAFGLAGQRAETREKRVAHWSRMMQLDAVLDSSPGNLSGGQRQRVALARALAMEPEALLLDEPLSALDAHLRRQMEEQLREAFTSYHGVTVFVTHDRDEAFRFCQDLAVLANGKTVAAGPKREVFDHPPTLAVARITGCKNFARIQPAGASRIRAEEWSCILTAPESLSADIEYVGIRAHDLRFGEQSGGENTFPCWTVATVESPFETTLYLRLHAPPADGDAVHLEAEISREDWATLARKPQPWYVSLDPDRLLFLKR
jgi:molybdate transport system permease protein